MIPDTMMWVRYACFVGLYAVWVIGYTFQTSVTRSAQSVLTNDPKQRPLFTIFNTIQAVNAARKQAVANGMSMEEAMRTITDETVK